MLFYYLDLAGVAVFAASGVLASRDRDLDLLGVIVVATLTAISGGTVRDLLLDRHPIFWVTDNSYLVVIIVSTMVTAAIHSNAGRAMGIPITRRSVRMNSACETGLGEDAM